MVAHNVELVMNAVVSTCPLRARMVRATTWGQTTEIRSEWRTHVITHDEFVGLAPEERRARMAEFRQKVRRWKEILKFQGF